MVRFAIDVEFNTQRGVRAVRGVGREVRTVETAAGRLRGALAGALTLTAAAAGIRQLTRYADTFTTVQNRLRTVTKGTAELTAATDALFGISNRTRQSFESTAELYARVGLAAQDLGRSQQELLQFTESVNQAVQLSGASATEASAGLIQLAQGLGSGALRGDELRSVLEQLPVVADVIADSLGVTRGELRQLGSEGKISAEIVLDAFREAREELDERFGQAVPTVGQAFTVLNNNILESIGALDQATGASAALATFLILISQNLDIAAGAVVVLAIALLAQFVPAAAAATVSFTSLAIAANAFVTSIGVVVGAFAALGVAAVVATNRIVTEFDKVQETINRATEAGEKFALTEFGRVGADIQRVSENLKRVEEVLAGDPENATAIALAERYRRQLELLGVAQDNLRDGTARTSVEARQQAAALEALANSVEGVIQGIERENELLGLNARERQVQIALAREIAALEADNDGQELTDGQREALEIAIRQNEELERRANVLERIQGPQQEFQADLDQLNTLLDEGRIDQAQYNTELARMLQAFEEISATDLQAILDGTQLPEGVTEGLQEYIDKLRELRDEFGDGEDGGGFTFPTDEAETFADALDRVRDASDSLTDSLGEGLERGFSRIVDRVTDVSGAVENVLVNAFGNAEDALVDFVTTGELDFSKFVDGLIADIARLIVRILVLKAIEAIGGGAGSAAGTAAGAITGAGARGGNFPSGRPIVVGEEGPEIFTPDGGGTVTPAGASAAIIGANTGGGPAAAPIVNVPAPEITNVFVNDPSEIPTGIESATGEQAVMNVIRRNSGQVRQMTAGAA